MAADLNISPNILEKIKNIKNPEILKTLASSLTSNLLNDDYILAGRLYMEAYLAKAPKDIVTYTECLTHRLHPKIATFLLNHEIAINEWFNKIHIPNYSYVKDFIAASKWVKSNLLNTGFKSSPIERPEYQALRIMAQLFCDEGIDKVLYKATEMFGQYYTHASPTLFNAGTKYPQMGSCFQIAVGDTMDSLMHRGVGDAAEITKNNGGVGADCNSVRHSAISFSGESEGLLKFLQIYDKMYACNSQGGKRPGAATMYFRDWHYDAVDVIKALPKDANPAHRLMNIQGCIWMSNLFIERVANNGMWTFFSPDHCLDMVHAYNEEFEERYTYYEQEAVRRESIYNALKAELAVLESEIFTGGTQDLIAKISLKSQEIAKYYKNEVIKYKTMKATEFMELICRAQIRDGPYIMHADNINRKSQVSNIGPINCSNLCTEIVQHTSEEEIPTCNLGALNLPKFVKSKVLNYQETDIDTIRKELIRCYDFEELGFRIRSLVENINRVIDTNFYPLDRIVDGKLTGPISRTNYSNRPLGIGVSGFYNAVVGMSFAMESQYALEFNKMVFACMYFNANLASAELAIRDGEYPTFRTSECKIFNEVSNEYETLSGSPLSNGYFQFDLARKEYYNLKFRNRLVEYETYENEDGSEGIDEIYTLSDIQPLEPEVWGQNGSWEELRKKIMSTGTRNSLLIAPMPTASTANIVSCVECFEAPIGVFYAKRLNDVNDIYAVPEFIEEITKMGIFDRNCYQFISASQGSIQNLNLFLAKFYPGKNFDWNAIEKLQTIFKTAYEISQRHTMKMSQQRGIYVDQSQSFNIFLANPKHKVLEEIHTLTSRMGLKTGIYYLRQTPVRSALPLSYDPDIVNFAEELINKQMYGKEDDEIVNVVEEGVYCTREEGCTSCVM